MTILSVQHFLGLVLLISSACSFAPSGPRHLSAPTVTKALWMHRGDDAHERGVSEDLVGVGRFFGIVATVSALSFGGLPTTALANTESLASISSSSVEIADTIRTLDMSLPTYDDISNYKTSVENTKSLSVDTGTQPLGLMTSKSKKASSSTSDASSSNPVGNFLPSMNKKSAAAKEADKAKTSTALPEYDF